jgi:hypothetical protein
VVENNFQEYFMKIRRNVSIYELGLQKSLRSHNVVLKILEHKVIDKTFVGIYRFEKNNGTLKDAVFSGKLSQYDKYSYMLRIAILLKKIHYDRDPKNEKLELDMSPSNFILLNKKPYSVEFIDLLKSEYEEYAEEFNEENLLKEQSYNVSTDSFVDAKAKNIFSMGLLFYFICFEEILDSPNDFDQENLRTLNQRPGNIHKSFFNEKFINLIREMLNFNPIDRPKLVVIINLLKEMKENKEFMFQGLNEILEKTYIQMAREVQQETFINAEVRNREEVNKFKKVSLEDKMNRIEAKIMKLSNSKQKKKIQDFIKNYNQKRSIVSNEIISKAKDMQLKYLTKIADKFGMINDMDNLDKLINLDETPVPREELVNPNVDVFFLNDIIDVLNMADELSLAGVRLKHNFYIHFDSYSIEYTDRFVDNEKSGDATVNQAFLYETLLNIQDFIPKYFKKKIPAFLMEIKSFVVDKFRKNLNKNKSSLKNMPYFIVVVISQLFTFGLIAVLFLKKSKYSKYQKENFSSYIVL